MSFVNLDLGLPLCFYDGMVDADKAGLQFVFPAYLLILTMTVIVLCHYCLQRSPTSSTSSCWYRFLRWPGRSRNKAVDIEHCAVDIEHCAVDIEHCALDIEHCALDIEQLT